MSKKFVLASSLILMSFSAAASGLSCDELKSTIEKKLEGKGVKGYTLTVLDKAAESSARVVGTCEAGSKKIVYERAKAEAK